MNTISTQHTVAEIVTHAPELACEFESLGIDYCCGGKKTLAHACEQKGLNPEEVVSRLREKSRSRSESGSDIAADVSLMSITDLVDHIENTHHSYLREELPRLSGMLQRIASLHGDSDPRLHRVRTTFEAMARELSNHMAKEEQCLFPMIRQLENSDPLHAVHGGTIAYPIRQMEIEHDDAGTALERMRDLTDGFTPPEWACKTYRALLAGLAYLERDMHSHVHKENNVLFPRALAMEAQVQSGFPVA